VNGRRVLNLGLRGSGPLSQLGVLREYALFHRPKRILWFILANDFLFDLERELNHPVLAGYFEGNIQDLWHRQPEIDEKISSLGGLREPPRRQRNLLLPSLITTELYRWLRPDPTRPLEEGKPGDFKRENLKTFAGILAQAKLVAEKNKIKVDFIFIPDSWIFTRAEGPLLRSLISDLKKELKEKGVELLDPTVEFEEAGEPLRRFAALDGYYGHYNKSGFRLLAQQVEKILSLSAIGSPCL